MILTMRRGRRVAPCVVPVKDWDGLLVIHKGMSAIVHQHLIDLTVDEGAWTATVCVKPVDDVQPLTDSQRVDIQQAANLLAKRAKRFYGVGWKIIGWVAYQPPPDRPIGGYTRGSGV